MRVEIGRITPAQAMAIDGSHYLANLLLRDQIHFVSLMPLR